MASSFNPKPRQDAAPRRAVGREPKDAREKTTAAPFGSLEDWRIYVVIGVSVAVIGGIILANVINSMKGATTVGCVQTMALFTLGMEEMHRDIVFDIDPAAAGDAMIMRALYNYFTFGEAGFEHDAQGQLVRPLRPLPQDQTAGLKRDVGNFFDLSRVPPCPKGGVYHFERVPGGDGAIPVVRCSEHGRLGRPDSQGRYSFDGRLRDLEPHETSMGFVATLVLPGKFKPPVDQITVVAAGAAASEADAAAPEPEPQP